MLEQERVIDLKSNMDRFIVLFLTNSETIFHYLKSNMDRFIVHTEHFARCIM